MFSSKSFFMKIKNSIYPTEYTRYGKNVKKQNPLFQKDLQLWSLAFSHRSYIYCLLIKNVITNFEKPLSKQNNAE